MTARKPTPDLMGPIDIMDDILSAGTQPPAVVSWHGKELDYPIDRIQVGKRMRPLGDIATLTESISQIGLLNPINILPDGTLIAGNHRLAAAKALGWTQIRVRVVELSEVDAELAEIDENLRRNNLTVLEESEHLLRREELLEAKGLRKGVGAPLGNQNAATEPQNNGETISPLFSKTTDIAKGMGLSERSAQHRLQIAKNLDTDAKAIIRTNEDIANSTTQLLELARQPAERQRTIADMLMSGKASNVNEAVRLLTPAPAPAPFVPPSPELPAWAHGYAPVNNPTYATVRELEGVIRDIVGQAKAQDLRSAARTGNGHWLYAMVKGVLDGRSEWRKSDLVQAFNNVAAQMEANTPPAPSNDDKLLVDWTEDDWAAYAAKRAESDNQAKVDETRSQRTFIPAALPGITILNNDALKVGDLVSDSVHLVVTSPPYNVGIEYDQHDDDMEDYLPFLTNVWRACYRVMVDGGRIAVVVPFGVGRNPYTLFDCQVAQTLMDAGFIIRGRIIWDKNTTGNRTSWGSYRLPSSPAIRDTTECIIVAHKGGDALEIPTEAKLRDEKGTYTEWLADGDYFMSLAQDHWVVAPESAQRVHHPAPFPVELVTRLMHFYAFPGAHVLDPFGGSGTVGVAAKQLGCKATLVEISAAYCALAQERITS